MVWMYQEQDICALRKRDVVDLARGVRRCYFKALADVYIAAGALAGRASYCKGVGVCYRRNCVKSINTIAAGKVQIDFIRCAVAVARLRDGYGGRALTVGCGDVIRSNWAIIGKEPNVQVAELQH